MYKCIKVSSNLPLHFQRYTPDESNIAKIGRETTDDRLLVLAFSTSPHSPLSVYQVSFIFNSFKFMPQTSVLIHKLAREGTLYLLVTTFIASER